MAVGVTHLENKVNADDPDSELYYALREGKGKALDAAVNALLRRIRGYICENFAPLTAEAEALAVDTIERVYERLEGFKGHSRFSTWVIGVAHYVALERLRERRRNQDICWEDLPDTLPDTECNPEREVIAEAMHQVNGLVVEEALSKLTALQRTVFELKHRENLNAAQIAERLGPPNTHGSVRSALVDASRNIEKWRKQSGYGGPDD